MKPNNPPAFPSDKNTHYEYGMTLRDYFAAKALAGLSTNFSTTPEQDASNAYKIADAMLAEREKGGEK